MHFLTTPALNAGQTMRVNLALSDKYNTELLYTRHTSSYLGVAFINPAESQSLSMLITGIYSVPTSHANYSGYRNRELETDYK